MLILGCRCSIVCLSPNAKDIKMLKIYLANDKKRAYNKTKGMADVMGGKVLLLQSERLLAEGGLVMLVTLVKDVIISIHADAEKAKMTEAEFAQFMSEQDA